MLAFLIGRRDHYRLLGPVIQLALTRGETVQVWRPRYEPRKVKWWRGQWEGSARFKGRIDTRPYRDLAELGALCTQPGLRAIYALEPFLPVKVGKATWIGVQFTIDVRDLETPPFDVVALHSAWWRTSAHSQIVGYPEMDQFHEGNSSERTDLLYCPYPWASAPVGRYDATLDRAVVQAVRAFATREGLRLVVKGRAKDPVPWYLWRVADRVVYDACYYPATIVDLMRRAQLCVHHFSGVALEAAYDAVPSIAIRSDHAATWTDRVWLDSGALDWPGVVTSMSLADAIHLEDIPRKAFMVNATAREVYLARYVGPNDGKASARLLDLAA